MDLFNRNGTNEREENNGAPHSEAAQNLSPINTPKNTPGEDLSSEIFSITQFRKKRQPSLSAPVEDARLGSYSDIGGTALSSAPALSITPPSVPSLQISSYIKHAIVFHLLNGDPLIKCVRQYAKENGVAVICSPPWEISRKENHGYTDLKLFKTYHRAYALAPEGFRVLEHAHNQEMFRPGASVRHHTPSWKEVAGNLLPPSRLFNADLWKYSKIAITKGLPVGWLPVLHINEAVQAGLLQGDIKDAIRAFAVKKKLI